MNTDSLVDFLQERTALGILSREILNAIAQCLIKDDNASNLKEVTINSDRVFITENTEPEKLYIVLSGQLESTSNNQVLSLLPGSTLNLYALLLNRKTQYSVKALSETKLLYCGGNQFKELVKTYPEITQAFSQQLANQVENLASKLNFEQEKQVTLRPYIVGKAKRGVIGKSRYAKKLRSQIKQVSNNRETIIIFGEPGLEKDNLAALIHFSSPYRKEAIVKIDCSKIQASGADLFGRVGGKPGIIEALGNGTLILNNIQQLSLELLPKIANLIKTNHYISVYRDGEPIPKPKVSTTRIIIISEQNLNPIDSLIQTKIKVPPLRVRKEDLAEQITYYTNLISRQRCCNKSRLTPEALRKLQAYDFPNNLRELEGIIERALSQLQGCDEITEEIVWQSQTKKKQYRLNLLNKYPQLRSFLRSKWYPDRINYWLVAPLFTIVVIVLFIAPQNRQENFALNLFWDWWWMFVLIGFPFVGRLWCAVCPFMIYGEITQKLSLYLFPRQLKQWNRPLGEKYGGWFLYSLFALILLWEELWNLENTAYLSACLLLLITAGAMIFSAIFERRFWCRYLCPIGGMNGMFAKLAMTELRAQQGTCSAECNTYQCYKGGVKKGEGMETDGCPLYSHPAQLEDNKDCVLCMTCLKACPHRSVEFNLRPPGIELWTTHNPRKSEVALLFLLLNVVLLHHLPEVVKVFHLDLNLNNFTNHSLLAIIVLILPILIPLLAYQIIKIVYKTQNLTPKKFINLAYGYLPLVLAGNLAHYLSLGLNEAGRILPVTMATFGLNGNNLPVVVADPVVISFLQSTTLIFGVLASIVLTQNIARKSLIWQFPQHLTIIGFAMVFNLIL